MVLSQRLHCGSYVSNDEEKDAEEYAVTVNVFSSATAKVPPRSDLPAS